MSVWPSSPHLASGRVQLRVRYPETDRMEVVYHAHYLVWFEMGRTELMRAQDCPYADLEQHSGIFFPVRQAGARYHVSARYDDLVTVETGLTRVAGASVRFDYRVLGGDPEVVLATGFTEHAAVGRDGRPIRIPAELRAKFDGKGEYSMRTGVRAAAIGFGLALILTGSVGCGKKKQAKTRAEPVTSDAMYRRGIDFLTERKLRQATNVFEQIEYSPDTRRELEPLARLAVADATFYQGTDLSLIDARSLYLDFVTLYGDHPMAPYAQTQVGLCSLKQVNQPSKDQTQTHRAIADFEEVIQRYPGSIYATAARTLVETAHSNLAQSEYLIGRFYLKRNAYVAAASRFRIVTDRYPDYPEKEKVLFHLSRALQLGGNDAEARIYLDKLVADYPNGTYVNEARRTLVQLGGSLAVGVNGLQD